MKQLILLTCLMAVSHAGLRGPNKRAISIFSVVSFNNDQCTTNMSPTMLGLCNTVEECTNKGGIASGNCASGFGVCCMFRVDQTKCGTTITNNFTYIQNTGFPIALTQPATALTCAYTVSGSSDICQIRLDFDNAEFVQPTATVCTNDKLTVTSPSLRSPPVLCGTLTGTHMYVETARKNPAATITIDVGAVAGDRTWKIRVLMIECGNPTRAPTDCLQYLTGISKSFQSYNFGKQIIKNQQNMVCIRQERGFCSFTLSESNTIATIDTFTVSQTGGGTPLSKQGTTDCANSYVFLQNKDTAETRFCGDFLNAIASQSKAGTLQSDTIPFRVGFVADATVAPVGTGYDLMYVQRPCK